MTIKQDYQAPLSLTNLLKSEKMAKAYEDMPAYILEMDEDALLQFTNPNQYDWRLRVRFWQLYRHSISTGTNEKIQLKEICQGICSDTIMKQKTGQLKKMAFILRPIIDFADEMETMLSVTYSKVWEIVNMNIKDKKGNIDLTKAKLMLQVHDRLVDRKFGSVKQLIEMKKLQVNVGKADLTSIDAELQRIEDTLGSTSFNDKAGKTSPLEKGKGETITLPPN